MFVAQQRHAWRQAPLVLDAEVEPEQAQRHEVQRRGRRGRAEQRKRAKQTQKNCAPAPDLGAALHAAEPVGSTSASSTSGSTPSVSFFAAAAEAPRRHLLRCRRLAGVRQRLHRRPRARLRRRGRRADGAGGARRQALATCAARAAAWCRPSAWARTLWAPVVRQTAATTDYWVLEFNYGHSTHQVLINVDTSDSEAVTQTQTQSEPPVSTIPEFTPFALVFGVIMASVAVAFARKKLQPIAQTL